LVKTLVIKLLWARCCGV